MKTLSIQSSAFPNGDFVKYESGMQKPELLPSNHPKVMAMRYLRSENDFKGSKSALRQARRIINGTAIIALGAVLIWVR